MSQNNRIRKEKAASSSATVLEAGYQAIAQSDSNTLFPVFFKAEQLHLLIVGGGHVGWEKLNAVLNNAPDADISIVALEIHKEIALLQEQYPNLQIRAKKYESDDLVGKDWVIVAVNDKDLSQRIRAEAHQRNLLVNVADVPELCDFYLGSIVRKGHLKIAISTNGKSPTIAKRLKETLQAALPDELNELLNNMEQIRKGLTGDFSAKVKKLNEITKKLAVQPDNIQATSERKWKKIAYSCIFAFLFMIIGHLVLPWVPFAAIYTAGAAWAGSLDHTFYLMILAGFLAQLVDGALGMGYGVTCTSVLLSIGVPLPAISGSIHAAEMFSSGASGLSHYKFGNVNKKLFRLLLIPGVLGAVGGAILLSWLGNEYANYIKPILAVYTLLLGMRILFGAFKKGKRSKPVKRVGWLAAAGGFLDSFGGGGWGPLVTSTLISKGKTPRYVIGTVSITEFFVTLSSALTFITMIGISHLSVIIGLIIGGVAATPIAARLAGKLPVKTMFIAVGILVMLWSLHILLRVVVPFLS